MIAMRLLTACALACPAPQDAPRIVPQRPSLTVVAHQRSTPRVRLGGLRRSVIQILSPTGSGVRRTVWVGEEVVGLTLVNGVVWYSTESGVHRLGLDGGEPVLVWPGYCGYLSQGPGAQIGFVGRRRDPARRTLRLAVLDLATEDVAAQWEIRCDASAQASWIDGRWHGAAAYGRGYRARSQKGDVSWTHVALDPTTGNAVEIESHHGVRGPGLKTKGVPPMPQWQDDGGMNPRSVPADFGRRPRSALLRSAGQLNHVWRTTNGEDWSLRLGRSGLVELVQIEREHSDRCLASCRVRSRELGAFFPEVDEAQLVRQQLRLGPLDAARPLAMAWGRDERPWTLHHWSPGLGLGDPVATFPAPTANAEDGQHWTWDPWTQQLCVHDVATGSLCIRGHGTHALNASLPFSSRDSRGREQQLRSMTWSLDGHRMLAVTGRGSFAELDLRTGRWSAPYESNELVGRAFAAPDGWVGQRRRGHLAPDAGRSGFMVLHAHGAQAGSRLDPGRAGRAARRGGRPRGTTGLRRAAGGRSALPVDSGEAIRTLRCAVAVPRRGPLPGPCLGGCTVTFACWISRRERRSSNGS